MSRLTLDIENTEDEGNLFGIGKGGCILQAKAKLMEILISKMAEYQQASDGQVSADIVKSIAEQYNLFLN